MHIQLIFAILISVFLIFAIFFPVNDQLRWTLIILAIIGFIVFFWGAKPPLNDQGGLVFYLLVTGVVAFIIIKVVFITGMNAYFTPEAYADYEMNYLNKVPEVKDYIEISTSSEGNIVVGLPFWIGQLKQVFVENGIPQGYDVLLSHRPEFTIKRVIVLIISLFFLWFLGTMDWIRSVRANVRFWLLFPYIVQFVFILFMIGFEIMSNMRWLLFLHSLLALSAIGIGMTGTKADKYKERKKDDTKDKDEKKDEGEKQETKK